MFHSFVEKLNTARFTINDIAEKFVGIVVLAMFGSLFTQVCCRYLLHHALSWPEEITMFLMAWMSFVGGGVALHRWMHIGIDFFTNKLTGRPHKVLMLVIRSFVLLFSCVLLVVGIDLVASSRGILSDGVRIPMVLPRLSMPIGAALMVFNSLVMLLEDIDLLTRHAKKVENSHG
jgi:TRAP-type C4-dicarboxylate transport system permease small subunit